jgi:membrane-bound lytic murein transglycosylase F
MRTTVLNLIKMSGNIFRIRQFYFVAVLLLFITLPYSCRERNDSSEPDNQNLLHVSTLKNIMDRGKLIALTNYNSTDYFVYKGVPMGYQYELLNAFASYLGVKLEIRVSNNMEESFDLLQSGEVDLIAKNLTVTKERNKIVQFSEPHTLSRQVLVQLKQDYSPKGQPIVRDQIGLAGKTIYVQENTTYAKRLRNLSDEIGDTINVVETSKFGVEELIGLVAQGKIQYTVCDEMVARVNKTYYPNIDVETPVSFYQKISWALNKNSDELTVQVNKWLVDFKKTKEFSFIYKRYFMNPKSVTIVKSGYYSINGGKISDYDEVIKNQSKIINWDWRLLASLICTESNFNPNARSWAGAYGLMQLMPVTFEQFKVDTLSTPAENIAAGVRLIKWLDDIEYF